MNENFLKVWGVSMFLSSVFTTMFLVGKYLDDCSEAQKGQVHNSQFRGRFEKCDGKKWRAWTDTARIFKEEQ